MYRVRLSYPVVWNHSELGPLKFVAVTGPANRQPSLWFNDWVPVDAHTATAVAQLSAELDARRPFFDQKWVPV
jgi:hypothetical protein